MFSARIISILGKQNVHEGVYFFENETLFLLIHGSKSHAETVLENLRRLTFENPIEDLQKFVTHHKNILVVKVKNNFVYAGRSGNMFLSLFRASQIHYLFDEKTKARTISGEIKPDDLFIFASAGGEKLINPEVLNQPLNKINETFNQQVESIKKSAEIGIAVIKFTEEPAISSSVSAAETPAVTASPSPTASSFDSAKDASDLSSPKLSADAAAPSISLAPTFLDTPTSDNSVTTDETSPTLPEKSAPTAAVASDATSNAANFLSSIFAKLNLKLVKIFAVILVLFFIAGITYTVINRLLIASRQKVDAEVKKITALQKQLSDAKDLINLNNARAGSLAKTALSEINKFNLKNLADKTSLAKIEALKKELSDTIKSAAQIKESKAALVWSPTLVNKNAVLSAFFTIGADAAILDAKNLSVYSVNLETRKYDLFDIKKYTKTPRLIAQVSDLIFVLGNNEVVQINTLTKSIKTALKKDAEWGNLKSIVGFLENIYLLDSKNSQIWKYLGNAGSFSLIKPYFSTKPDLSNAVSFAIDSSVYLAFADGKILKFKSGESEKFTFKIPDKTLQKPVQIVTNDKLEKVYVLESSQKRILVLDKDGKYVSQVVDNKLELATSFGVSEKSKTIYFPIGNDVYKIGL